MKESIRERNETAGCEVREGGSSFCLQNVPTPTVVTSGGWH